MADEYPWCRWYNEVISDPKLERIARRSNIPFVTVLGAWGMILALASRSPERGRLMLSETIPLEHRDLLDDLAIPEANEILDAFFSLGLLEQDEEGVIVITHWEKRQPASDNSTQRQREYRARRRKEPKPGSRPQNGGVTNMSRDKAVTVATPDIDTETDQYTYSDTRTREAQSDLPPEPNGFWGDDLAEDLGDVVDAAAPEAESYAAAYRQLKNEHGFEGFPPVKTQRDVQLLPLVNTPAVYTWVSVTFHAPSYDQLPYLIKHLGTNPNRDVLRAVWELWRANDYSPGKIIGVLEWYHLRLKDPNWQPKYGQKARASPKAKANGVHPVSNGKPEEFDWDTIGQVM